MSFEINEVTSLILQNSLKSATEEAEKSMVRLSHGKQVQAMENAANMMIAEGMESQRRGSRQAIENAQTGMNMLSTAESGLSGINDNLQRVRELAVQRENGTLSNADRSAIDSEIDALTEEIDRVAKSTSYGDQKLLDGSSGEVTLQVGPNSEAETNSVKIGDALSSVSSTDLGLDKTSPGFLSQIDNALDSINSKRSDIGAMSNRLESTIDSLYVQNENLTASQSRIIDVDVAEETSKLTQSQILQNSSASLLAQANQSPSIASLLL